MAGGRPTKYDPAFCDVVVDFMSQGYSRMAAAGEIGVTYETFREWVKIHPEFSVAVSLGMARRLKFLEMGLIMAESGPQVTSRIFALKNAAPEEWQDRKAVDVSNPDGSLAPRPLDVSKLSTAALSELLDAMTPNDAATDEG